VIRLFTSLTARVQVHVTGCPTPLVNMAIQQAATEFCNLSTAWRIDLPPVTVVALTFDYTLATGVTGANVRMPLVVRYKGAVLPNMRTQDRIVSLTEQPDVSNPNTPRVYDLPNSRTLRLLPVPSAADAGVGLLQVHASVTPTATSTGVDDDVFTDNEETLLYGALTRLLTIPGKAWLDVKMGDFYGRKFRNACFVAKARVENNFVQRTLNVEIPRIA